MCYYNGIKVTKAEYIRLKELEKTIAFLSEGLVIHKGFDYNDFPVIRPLKDSRETERVDMQWGFLPRTVASAEAIKNFRFGYKTPDGRWVKGYTTLNATSEELLNGLYRDAALNRRCLIPSNGFYEWMHVQVVGKSGKLLKTPEKFPYLVEIQGQEEFYMAGVWQPCFIEDVKMTVNTFALLTAPANTLMKQIHNSKERMPTILPGHLVEAWLYKDLTPQEILDIANYQVAAFEMKATPLHKDFLKRENPHEAVTYKEVPELVYS
jgi:putative SOS response-associated peptidase YedK